MTIINENSDRRVDTTLGDLADACRDDRDDIPGLPYFSPEELQQMHRYCLKYRDLVRGGGTPTPEQDTQFMVYQRICHQEGVAHG